MKKTALRPLLVILFFLLIFSPLFLMPFTAERLGRGFQREFSVILGFIGLTMAGWQLAPISRFTPAQKLFNMDKLYRVHHFLSVASAVFVLVHYLLLLFNFEAGIGINGWALNLLNVFTAPLRAQMGVLSLLAYLLITLTSVFRKPFKLGYDAWRVLHDIFTLLLVGGGLAHVLLVARYSAAPAMNALLWVQTALWVLAALYIRVFKPLWQLRHPWKITRVHQEVETVYTLRVAPRGFAVPAFHPGQVAWLTVRRSPFSLSRHPFSIASSASNRDYYEFAIKKLGDFTNTIGQLKKGETVYVDGPFGHYDVMHSDAPGIVLIAGGIGVAPAMSVLRSMKDAKDPRPVRLFYGHNVLEHVEFRQELEALQQQLRDFRCVNVLQHPPANWKGYSGFITTEVLQKELPQGYRDFSFFVCGPLPMMAAIRASLTELGVPRDKAHYEEFNMA
ncbi:MAG: ferric reductase-like transmembrane domain-containing protein [Anaerolineae bacterium]|nr:ferric reductase-like transmembrane domain-containing protein [Anaerolineae bacterium]